MPMVDMQKAVMPKLTPVMQKQLPAMLMLQVFICSKLYNKTVITGSANRAPLDSLRDRAESIINDATLSIFLYSYSSLFKHFLVLLKAFF